MDRRIYGPRVIGAVVPRYFATVQALQIAAGMSYSTLNDWANGKADPRLEHLDKIVEAVRAKSGENIDPLELLAGRGKPARGQLHSHPDWPAAVAEARSKHPGKLSPGAYAVAGMTAPARWPERIDAELAYDLAGFWHKHASDDDLARVETAAAQAEMDAEDAAVEHAVRAATPANAAAPAAPKGRPRKARARG